MLPCAVAVEIRSYEGGARCDDSEKYTHDVRPVDEAQEVDKHRRRKDAHIDPPDEPVLTQNQQKPVQKLIRIIDCAYFFSASLSTLYSESSAGSEFAGNDAFSTSLLSFVGLSMVKPNCLVLYLCGFRQGERTLGHRA